MDRRFRAFLLPILVLVFWFPVSTAHAFPVLPSSFYGVVKHGDRNVADGTLVEAWLNDQVLASGYTRTYQGNSVYSLDVRGDDGETVVVDGGREGDRIQFKVGGVLASESGTWHSGTNAALNLTVDRSAALDVPRPTRTSSPSQTPIATSRPSAMDTPVSSGLATLVPGQPSNSADTQPVPGADVDENGGSMRSTTLPESQSTVLPAQKQTTAVVGTAPQADIVPQTEGQHEERRAVIPAIGAIVFSGLIGILWFRSRK